MLECDDDGGAGSEDGGSGEPGEPGDSACACAFTVTQLDDGGIVIDNPLGNWSFLGNSSSGFTMPYHSETAQTSDGFIELSDRNHCVSVSVDCNSIFSVGSPVYRSVQLMSSASDGHEGTFGSEQEALSVTLLDKDLNKKLVNYDPVVTVHLQVSPLKTLPRKTSTLRSYPPLPLTTHVFETALEPDLAVARINAWLDSKSQMFYDFSSSEVSWNCSHREFCSQLVFDLGIYKLPNAGRHQPKYVIEMLRRGGDRLRHNHLFNELKFLFLDENRMEIEIDHSIELPSSLSGSADRMPEPDLEFISEEKIKQTILLALQDASCDYSTKAEAIRLAGCIFTRFERNNASVSSIDRDIIQAVASLRHSNIMFDWVAIPPALAAIECH